MNTLILPNRCLVRTGRDRKLAVHENAALEEKLDFLDAVFSDASVRQQWRRPPEEAEIQLWHLEMHLRGRWFVCTRDDGLKSWAP